jgi:hypothetical protein
VRLVSRLNRYIAPTENAAVQSTTLKTQVASELPPTSGKRAICATPYGGMYGAMFWIVEGKRLVGTKRPPTRGSADFQPRPREHHVTGRLQAVGRNSASGGIPTYTCPHEEGQRRRPQLSMSVHPEDDQ